MARSHQETQSPRHLCTRRLDALISSMSTPSSAESTVGASQDNPIAISDDESPAIILRQSFKGAKAHQTRKAAPALASSKHSSRRRITKEGNGDGKKMQRRQGSTRSPTSPAAALEVTVSCVICTNDVPKASLPSFITAACSHQSQTCLPCISSWIASRLQSSGHGSLTCPQCDERLHDGELKAFATPEIYEQYGNLVLRSLLSDDPEFHWCIGPGCQSGQLHADSNPIFRCARCGFRSCIEHNVPWHDGLSCTKYDSIISRQRETEEVASIKKVKEISKRCPGVNCGWPIEKNNGCDHMTCHNCRTEFCWLCKASYKDIIRRGNVAHESSCRHHSSNLPDL